jgi:hypothetical protein
MYSQYGGRILRWDATFNAAKKTMDDPETDEKIDCLLFLRGEWGNILGAYYMDEDTSENAQRALFIYRRRVRKLFGPRALNAVIAGYTDTCCEGMTDPTDHWFAKMFPNVKWAPYKDTHHAMKLVTDSPSTHGGGHALHRGFCRGIRDVLYELHEERVSKCIDAYMLENPRMINRALARDLVKNDKNYKQRIPNAVRGAADKNVAIEARALLQQAKVGDEDGEKKALAQGEYYPRYVKGDGPDGTYGTHKQMENFLAHHGKGCYDDPLPIEQMFYKTAPPKSGVKKNTKPPVIHKLRGTNVVERGNRGARMRRWHTKRLT